MTAALADRLRDRSWDDLVRVHEGLSEAIVPTPLLPSPGAGETNIRLKAEHRQRTGSFKARCAFNIVANLPTRDLDDGIVTASAGNFALALAEATRQRGIALTVHLPSGAPTNRVAALHAAGAATVRHSFEDWWAILQHGSTGQPGRFVHPFAEPDGILGNATLTVEIFAQAPDADTIVAPIGGGGLLAGIALAARRSGRAVRVLAVEMAGAAPLAAAFAQGTPVTVDRTPSFAAGGGRQAVHATMWPLLRDLADGAIEVSETQAWQAFRDLIDAGEIVEPQAAMALAAARTLPPSEKVVAILSGGNVAPALVERAAARESPNGRIMENRLRMR